MAETTEPKDPWQRLADAVVKRREERGWSQLDVATRGGLSIDRIQAIEGTKESSYRAKTLRSLERGLDWAEGSVQSILAGQDLIPVDEPRRPTTSEASPELPDLSHLSPAKRREFIRQAMDRLPLVKEYFPSLYDRAQDQIIELTRKYGDDDEGDSGEQSRHVR